MTQVIMSFLAFLNGWGFASALVQSDSIDPFRIRQAFGLLLLLNAGLAAIQFFGAPLAAAYYGHPKVADLLRVQALLYLATRSEEHTSELQSLMRTSYAVFCLTKK